METYDDFFRSFSEICEDGVGENKIKGVFKKIDSAGAYPPLSLVTIENFKAAWRRRFSRGVKSTREIVENWHEFASEGKERRRLGGVGYVNEYVVRHVVDDKTGLPVNLSLSSFSENEKKAVEWIDGERRRIYDDVFGVPCHCYADMAPWEKERWINFFLQVGADAANRIWRNFCESENSYYHQQPGLAIDKIWQHVGVLNRGPNHEDSEFGEWDLKSPEKLA